MLSLRTHKLTALEQPSRLFVGYQLILLFMVSCLIFIILVISLVFLKIFQELDDKYCILLVVVTLIDVYLFTRFTRY